MKIAIITVTNKGALLADKLQLKLLESNLTDVSVFTKNGRNPLENNLTYSSLKNLIAETFCQYDALIFIMAVGITVRVIAPYIQDKRYDPAVLVIDDGGNHVISLLSGHIGGANELTKRVANLINSVPVITTATDVAGKPAADTLAVNLNLKIEPFSRLKTINAAIVNEDIVSFYIDCEIPKATEYVEKAKSIGVYLNNLSISANSSLPPFSVVITDKELGGNSSCLFLRPPTLCAGIGCRRGTSKEQILNAIQDACSHIKRSPKSIYAIASSVVKENEPGLRSVINMLGVENHFYTNEQLESCIIKNKLASSKFVKSQIGVGNVCEASAILAGQTNQLLLKKKKYPNVTIAIVQGK